MIARPTRKAYALGLGALVVFLAGSNVQAGWLYVLGAAMVGVIAAGLVMPAAAVRKVSILRHIPVAARVGDRLLTRLGLGGSGTRVIAGTDRFMTHTEFSTVKLPAQFEYELECTRRGIYAGGPVQISSGFPFGMGVASRSIDVPSPVIVHPRWVELGSFPLLEAVSAPSESIHDRRRRGGGLEFYGIREYRSGDSLRHVHWKSAARTGRLLLREYEDEPASRLGVLIDCGQTAGTEPNTAFEDGAAAAASIALYALGVGHPVQLFAETSQVSPHLFEPGRNDALDWLSAIEPSARGGITRVAEAATDHVRPRSTNVLVFPTLKRNANVIDAMSSLQALSTRVIAVVISALSHAPQHPEAMSYEEEEDLTSLMAAHRVTVYRIRGGEDLQSCLSDPLLL